MALINFIRQGVTTVAQTINFSVAGTATLNTDYTVAFPPGITGTWGASSGSVVIPIGASQVDVTLAIVGDTALEEDETVVIAITSVSPATGISPSNSSCVLVIKNDDYVATLKVLGIGLFATALVGSIPFNNTCFVSSNSGNAPANWSNWLSGSSSNGNSNYDLVSSPNPNILPALAKQVIRSPVTAPVDTTTLYFALLTFLVTQTFLGYRGNSSGTWDMVYTVNGGVTGYITTVGVSVWSDVITEFTVNTIKYNVDGVTTVSYTHSATNATNNGVAVYFRNQIAMAAISTESGRAYSPSMFPITAINL